MNENLHDVVHIQIYTHEQMHYRTEWALSDGDKQNIVIFVFLSEKLKWIFCISVYVFVSFQTSLTLFIHWPISDEYKSHFVWQICEENPNVAGQNVHVIVLLEKKNSKTHKIHKTFPVNQ